MVVAVVIVVVVVVLMVEACSSGRSFVIVVATAIVDERIVKNVFSAMKNTLLKRLYSNHLPLTRSSTSFPKYSNLTFWSSVEIDDT